MDGRYPDRRMSRTATDRRSEILDAVVGVIIDIGFTEMTVADVARRANVSTALVHYHFSSKDALIAAALRAASDDDKEFRDALATGPGTAVRRLVLVLTKSLPDATDPSWILWIETWGETRRSDEIRAVMADLNVHERSTIVRLIDEGIAAGEFHVDDRAGVASRLTALRDGLAIERTLFGDDGDMSGDIDGVVGQVREAIRYNLQIAPDRFAELTAD